MENDNKSKSNTWQQAFCLLEVHLTRANREKKLKNKKLMAGAK
jgi:hypothetical protein